MTSHEIRLIGHVLDSKFGNDAAVIGRLLLENGETSIRDIHKKCFALVPRVSRKKVERTLQCFFQNGLLTIVSYPSMLESLISLDINRSLLLLSEPALCYAVEELIGEDAAQIIAMVLSLASPSAEKLLQEIELAAQINQTRAEEIISRLIRKKVITALDINCQLDQEELIIDTEVLSRKRSWSTVALKANPDRLMVIFLLYLSHSWIIKDPAIGVIGGEVYLGACRASLSSTSRTHFLCDEWFVSISCEDVFRELPESADEEIDLTVVEQNLSNITQHTDGFLIDIGKGIYCLKGSKILGALAEHFLYETIKLELPQLSLGRAVLQYLIRNPKPYVQLKAFESELFGSVSAIRFACNELSRLGFVDLMGTSHVTAFEPGRTELFAFVNAPRLFRQKIQYEQIQTLIRNIVSKENQLVSSEEKIKKIIGKRTVERDELTTPEAVDEKYSKMELGFIDCYTFAITYIQAVERICEDKYSRDAYSLVEFYGRKMIPEIMEN